MNARTILGTLLFISLYTSLHVYIAYIISVALGLSFYFTMAAVIILAYIYIGGSRISLFKTIGSIWFGCLSFFVLVFPAAHLLLLFLSIFYSFSNVLIYMTGSIILLFLVYWIVGLYCAYQPVTRSYTINLNSLQEPFTFILASDMHFGGLSGTAHVQRLVKEINKHKADLVLLCGDIVDDDPKVFTAKNQHKIMAELHAEKGVFAVTGNHEYYGKDIEGVKYILEKSGIRLLEDETVYIPHVGTIAGRKDKTDRHRKSVGELLRSGQSPLIVMDHQPTALKEIQAAGADISLGGHTHRGQIWPYNFITKKMFPLDWGYKQFGELHSFVSSGFGFWGPPLRIGSRSEIVLVKVRQK